MMPTADVLSATRVIEQLVLEKKAAADAYAAELRTSSALLFALAVDAADEKGKVRLSKPAVDAGATVESVDVKILKAGSVVLTVTLKAPPTEDGDE